tara:strand:+ start:394 stop:687 length:294 start_codon:yes stop_codon:yes gene_type:complete
MDKKINNDNNTDKNTDKNTDTTTDTTTDTNTDTTTDTIKNEIKFAKTWDKAFGKNMDEDNKKALNVMKTEGVDAAVKHMFTDSGRQLSYAEMRMRYG